MKIRIVLMALVVAFTSYATAQEKKEAPKMTEEQKVEFRVAKMQKSLGLDEATAAKFAPLYKEYIQELAKCRPELKRGKELTEEQVKENIEARIDAKEKSVKVEKKYYGKFSKILDAKQLQKLFSEPKAFNKNVKGGFAPQGKRPGQGFAKAPGRKATMMKPGFKPGFNKGNFKKGDFRKPGFDKGNFRKGDFKKRGFNKMDCPKGEKAGACKQSDCKKGENGKCEKKADCKKVDCKKAGNAKCEKKADCKKADCKK